MKQWKKLKIKKQIEQLHGLVKYSYKKWRQFSTNGQSHGVRLESDEKHSPSVCGLPKFLGETNAAIHQSR